MTSASSLCAQHPDRRAIYRCDGCERLLCEECVREGHALFLCGVCGERALPLDSSRADSVPEQRRQRAIEGPYRLGQAFAYAFRGMGKYLYAATLASMAFISFILTFAISCLPFVFALAFWALMIGLQFKIVRTTAEGDNELPDWPEYFSWGERFRDIAIYLWASFLQFAPLVAYFYLFGGRGLLTLEASLPFWLGAAAVTWFGTGLAVFAMAASSLVGGGGALRLDQHLRGFVGGRGDALAVTNLTFGIGATTFLVRTLLETLPLLGAVLSGMLGAYWVFTSAHLVGVLVRRRRALFEELYR